MGTEKISKRNRRTVETVVRILLRLPLLLLEVPLQPSNLLVLVRLVLAPLTSRIGTVPSLLLRQQLLERRLMLLRLDRLLLVLLRRINLDALLRRLGLNLDLARRRNRLRRLFVLVRPTLLPLRRTLVLAAVDGRLLAVRATTVLASESSVLAERGDVT